jgi:hypothetical protein
MKSLAERMWKIKNLWFGVDKEARCEQQPTNITPLTCYPPEVGYL